MGSPRTILPDPRKFPRFAGIATFARFPLLTQVSAEHRPIDWLIYGAPCDSGVTYRPGARFGPRAIRDESQYVKPYHLAHDVVLTEVLSMADAGDAPVEVFGCQKNAEAVSAFAESLPDPSHTRLLMLGGDHSNTLANMRATWRRRGKPGKGLALLHFDAHLDTVDVTGGEKYSHASPFIRAVEEGILDPRRMLSVGIRGPLNTPADLDFARRHGVEIITCDQWRAEGNGRIESFLGRLGDDEAYLTFDIDCIDPAFAPGTGTPSVGGFSSAEVLSLLRLLARGGSAGRGVNVVGADVVEVLPDRDHAGVTSLLAAHIAFEILCLDAVRRRSSSSVRASQR